MPHYKPKGFANRKVFHADLKGHKQIITKPYQKTRHRKIIKIIPARDPRQCARVRSVSRKSRDLDGVQRGDGGDEVKVNARGATTRAQSPEAPASATQILRACAVEVHIDDVENHECTVNSSELAVHGRALQRSKRQLLFHYRKNSQCAHTIWGTNVTKS